MAIGAGCVFQVQSTATAGNLNGGGFNPGNANGITDGVIASGTGDSPTLTSATYTFVAGDVGYHIYFPAQANMTAGWYSIASVAAGVATLSAAIGQASQVTNNRYGTNTVAGCATTAAPTGVTYLVDYSRHDTARYSNSVLTGTTTSCTDATNPFTAQMVGNFMCIASGTGITAGWYEIVSVAAGTATLSSSAGASYSLGVIKIGGAVSLGGTTTGITDTIFFGVGISSATAAARYFIKGGSSITYTLGQTVAAGTAGNASWPIIVEGYATNRGDMPNSVTRPTLALGANTWTGASNTANYSLQFTGTSSAVVTVGGSSVAKDIKCLNTSTTAGRTAISCLSSSTIINCEATNYRGIGFGTTNQNVSFNGCYSHDCNTGISNTTGQLNINNCIVANCVTQAIAVAGANVNIKNINNCTIYGAENKLGIALNMVSGATICSFMNNIIYGFVTGVTHADTQTVGYDDYNDYFNNTSDVSAATQWQKGPNDIAVNPSFANVAQITGTTATTTAGNHLVQSGATFVTSGVTAGRDCVHIISGTGVTVGIYGIASVDSETQITTDIAITADATANKVWQITTGRNFAPGVAVKALGFPGAFPGALTTSYNDIGAVQRQETAPSMARVRTGM